MSRSPCAMRPCWAVPFRRLLLMKRVTTEGGGCVFTPPLRRPPPPVTLWVKPGSSNRTHDPWSISARVRETCCLSVSTRISMHAGRAGGAGRATGAGRAGMAAGRFPPIIDRKANGADRRERYTAPRTSTTSPALMTARDRRAAGINRSRSARRLVGPQRTRIEIWRFRRSC